MPIGGTQPDRRVNVNTDLLPLAKSERFCIRYRMERTKVRGEGHGVSCNAAEMSKNTVEGTGYGREVPGEIKLPKRKAKMKTGKMETGKF